MKKYLTGIRLFSLILLCACLALVWKISLQQLHTAEPLPRAQRQLVTVWIYGDRLGASPWVREQTAAYQKAHPGASIWVRTASGADMDALDADFPHTAPDLLLFMAGEEVKPEWLEELSFCRDSTGQYAGRQLAVPVCMAGYALVRASKEASTPAPTSLFGVTPAPAKTAAATPVPREKWPQNTVTDDRFGAWLLLQLGITGEILPEEQAMEAFLQGKAESVLLSTLALRKLSARGMGMEVLSSADQTDLVLYGAAMRESSAEARAFLTFLCSSDAQQQLADAGLISPHGGRLYGAGTPILQSTEQALQKNGLVNAFDWQNQAQSTFMTGQAMQGN
ncbi:MAG: hypothetical protein IKW00_00550 [Clostridia bacterium]|nr:hypothetical protein [Clostridia bacterium]